MSVFKIRNISRRRQSTDHWLKYQPSRDPSMVCISVFDEDSFFFAHVGQKCCSSCVLIIQQFIHSYQTTEDVKKLNDFLASFQASNPLQAKRQILIPTNQFCIGCLVTACCSLFNLNTSIQELTENNQFDTLRMSPMDS